MARKTVMRSWLGGAAAPVSRPAQWGQVTVVALSLASLVVLCAGLWFLQDLELTKLEEKTARETQSILSSLSKNVAFAVQRTQNGVDVIAQRMSVLGDRDRLPPMIHSFAQRLGETSEFTFFGGIALLDDQDRIKDAAGLWRDRLRDVDTAKPLALRSIEAGLGRDGLAIGTLSDSFQDAYIVNITPLQPGDQPGVVDGRVVASVSLASLRAMLEDATRGTRRWVALHLTTGEILVSHRDVAPTSDPMGPGVTQPDGVRFAVWAAQTAETDYLSERVLTSPITLSIGTPRGFVAATLRERMVPFYAGAFVAALVFLLSAAGLFRALGMLEQARQTAVVHDARKTAFLESLSHELRTPLNAVLGYADVMRGDLLGKGMPPLYQGYAEAVHEGGRALLGLVDEILDLSAIAAGRARLDEARFAIADLREQCANSLDPADLKDRVVWRHEDEDTVVLADRRRIALALTNLLHNGLQHSPQDRAVEVRVAKVDGAIELRVLDSGEGHLYDDLESLFEPFIRGQSLETTDTQGLGLPIVRRYAEAHGGSAWLEPREAGGLCGVLRLPPDRVVGGAVAQPG